MPIQLTDSEMHEVQQAAAMVPRGLRGAFLERVAAELRGKDLGDGLVHQVVYSVARELTWSGARTATG